jgi:hypothetical protein
MDILAKLIALAEPLAQATIATIQAVAAAHAASEADALAALDKAVAAYDDLELATGSLRMLIAKNKQDALDALHKKFDTSEPVKP